MPGKTLPVSAKGLPVSAHDNSQIHLVVGPPGTGKTTYLSRQIARAAEHFDPSRVVVTSLTKAAATEIGRKIELPERNVGTLHSICYRMLQFPEMILQAKHLEAWNNRWIGKSEWLVQPIEGNVVDKGSDPLASPAKYDGLMEQVDLLRHQLIPFERWPEGCQAFHTAWTMYKAELDAVDFTDLIEQVATSFPYPPGDTAVLVVDEGQDMSALETMIIRNWSSRVNHAVVAGDADQVLYDWRGADPALFLPNGVPEANVHSLEQSYRVPKQVHAFALELIEQCENRRKVRYLPTEVEGSVRDGAPAFDRVGWLVDELAEKHAQDHNQGSVMFLAPCGFSLDQIIRTLRSRGLPFHNPYRRRNGRWNPLGPHKGTSLADRMIAFTALARTGQPWSLEQMRAWVGGLAVEKTLVRGVKTRLGADDFVLPRTVEELATMLREPSEVGQIIAGNLDWYREHAATAYRDRLDYPLQIVRRFGIDALEAKPRIIVGTIHSVKGGEAEDVVLCPDLSFRGADQLMLDPDSIRRLMYVGATRARRDLYIAEPSRRGQHACRLW